jgi:5-methylcytosine-specific restriction endonuclease McrA
MKRDTDKTAAANFLDPRSFVRPDGRQERHGKDMEILRRAVFERSGGQCECVGECNSPAGAWHHVKRCITPINWFTMELSHKIPRSKGRDDSEANTIASCAACHRAYDGRQPRWSKKP